MHMKGYERVPVDEYEAPFGPLGSRGHSQLDLGQLNHLRCLDNQVHLLFAFTGHVHWHKEKHLSCNVLIDTQRNADLIHKQINYRSCYPSLLFLSWLSWKSVHYLPCQSWPSQRDLGFHTYIFVISMTIRFGNSKNYFYFNRLKTSQDC